MSASTKEAFTYLPDDGLRAAYEVARDLDMPLLLTGEPGTGKTEFARWIAREQESVLKILHHWRHNHQNLLYSGRTRQHSGYL